MREIDIADLGMLIMSCGLAALMFSASWFLLTWVPR